MTALPLSSKQILSIVEAEQTRIALWAGAVRSGKTVASIIAFMAAVADAPQSGLILITGRTLQTIERNIINPMQDRELMGPLAAHVQHTRGASTATILGREVHLIGAADARAEGKLRGLTACLAMVDEATLIPEDFWTQLLARLSVPGARLLATTNPGGPAHWLKVKFLDKQHGLNMRSWHFMLDDNPGLSDEYRAAVKAENTGLFYRRNVLGEWVAAEGAVYDCWDPDVHVVAFDELPQLRRVLALGCDWGMTNASSGILLGLGVDDCLYALDEWWLRNTADHASATVAQQSSSLRGWLAGNGYQPEWLVVDPSAAAFKTQLFNDGAGNITDAVNDVVYGISLVSSLLASGRLRVSDRCVNLIRELPSYSWDDRATEKGEDRPLKIDDHACDALRYSVATTEALWRPYLRDLVA